MSSDVDVNRTMVLTTRDEERVVWIPVDGLPFHNPI